MNTPQSLRIPSSLIKTYFGMYQYPLHQYGLVLIISRDRKKKRKIRSERHAIVQPVSEPVETSFNPVYDNTPQYQEPVYTTVKKVKPEPSPISPVVIPAPQNLEPLTTEAPQNLEPVEVEEPVPVIETEVLPDKPAEPEEVAPRQFQPEYEDRIETEVVEEPPQLPPPPPEAVEDNTIEVVIDDSPLPSPAQSSTESKQSGPNVTTVVI
ncbi:hypothetical protein ElyMa_002008100 [Elysia marginata]|uniref:Uncharacterized protein n=1 Tax=Elysia marginata TaxID=1093978 RepID=A0AAV4F3I1_9GAST|nr:hypothetical protein ElyMa_002008100 [Elysia marginata]